MEEITDDVARLSIEQVIVMDGEAFCFTIWF